MLVDSPADDPKSDVRVSFVHDDDAWSPFPAPAPACYLLLADWPRLDIKGTLGRALALPLPRGLGRATILPFPPFNSTCDWGVQALLVSFSGRARPRTDLTLVSPATV